VNQTGKGNLKQVRVTVKREWYGLTKRVRVRVRVDRKYKGKKERVRVRVRVKIKG